MGHHRRRRDEAGETLVEIVLTVVLIGLTVTALLAGLGTAAAASKQHRDVATADVQLRSFAEAVKQAVRTDCRDTTTVATTYDWARFYTPRDGFTPSGADGVCPTSTTQPTPLTLVITDAEGHATDLEIVVRKP